MCGITGFIDAGEATSAEALEHIVGNMASTLEHRGPDDDGTWVDPRSGIALGHTRLSIIDPSPDGHQPMMSQDGRFVLVFNGEIYNFPELRSALTASGTDFRGHSDTEVLVEAFASWGVEQTLQRSNGMFAFAAWDRSRRELSLARDRLGEKPLYYGWIRDTFLFTSELKALLPHPSFEPEIDRDAVALFLRYNYIPAPYSIYRGIRKLPAGAWTVVEPERGQRSIQPRAYWSLLDAAQDGVRNRPTVPPEKAVDELENLLSESVRMRMISDVPLGAFLSGGIDSSTIVALMQQHSHRPVRTFSIGFHEPDYDEAAHAKQVAEHLGTDHTELYVSPERAQAVIPRLAGIYDEPFADSSQIPTILVSELARRDVTVALSGDGGDELFGGYERYLFHRQLWNKFDRVPAPLRRLAAGGIRSVSTSRWDQIYGWTEDVLPRSLRNRSRPGEKAHKLAGILDTGGAERMYLELMTHWDDPASIVLGASEPVTLLRDPSRWELFEDPTDEVMYLDAATYLPDDILVKVDRASMSTSLEVRVPLLDHRVIEFAWGLPEDMKIRDGIGKWTLRQVLYRHVPRELVERPKMGFGVPIGDWLRGPLRGWAEDLLDPARLRREGMFDPGPIRKRWDEHVTGAQDWKYPLWDVLMFQSWWEDVRSEGHLASVS